MHGNLLKTDLKIKYYIVEILNWIAYLLPSEA